jgi:hypothetical protein
LTPCEELQEAEGEKIEIESVLFFAQMVLLNAANVANAGPPEQKE